jgi:hypothetical protein
MHMRYVYKNLHNLTSSELFLWVMVDETMDHFGVEDVAAVLAILLGLPLLPTRTKPLGAIRGTSVASVVSRQLLNYDLKARLPTLTGLTPWTMRLRMTKNLGAFAGRAVPLVGWFILATDVVEIVWSSVLTYNTLVPLEDRLTL